LVEAEARLAENGPTHLSAKFIVHWQGDRKPLTDPVRSGDAATIAREVGNLYLVYSTAHGDIRFDKDRYAVRSRLHVQARHVYLPAWT
jgi:hypothetical protein